MIETAQQMTTLVDSEISKISDPIVLEAIQRLRVNPVAHQRKWYYGEPDETLLCWSILEDQENNCGIVYSDFGFGPKCPWGLAWLSTLDIGDDAGWFKSLESAFYDSFSSSSLKIWRVLKKNDQGDFQEIATDLTDAEAYELRNNARDLYVSPRGVNWWAT